MMMMMVVVCWPDNEFVVTLINFVVAIMATTNAFDVVPMVIRCVDSVESMKMQAMLLMMVVVQGEVAVVVVEHLMAVADDEVVIIAFLVVARPYVEVVREPTLLVVRFVNFVSHYDGRPVQDEPNSLVPNRTRMVLSSWGIRFEDVTKTLSKGRKF